MLKRVIRQIITARKFPMIKLTSAFNKFQPSNYVHRRPFCISSYQKCQHKTDLETSSGEQSDPEEAIALDLTQQEIDELSIGNPETVKKIKYIQLECDVFRQEGDRVPQKIKIKPHHWKELLELTSRHQRLRYYHYLWNIEMSTINDKIKRKLYNEKRLAELGPLPPLEEDIDGMTYALNRNTLFLRLYETKVNAFLHSRVVSAMQFSTPMVFDLGYDEFMNRREAKNCAQQLELVITSNRSHPNPLNLHFCNKNKDSIVVEELQKRIPTLFEPHYPLNIYEQSYLDMFPKNRLIYLSPHAKEELLDFDPEDVYIVGAMVDKSDPRPFSLAKAKKEGVRMKKLPLERFLDWGLGGKSLTLNQMMAILLEFHNSKDWNKALDYVPKRKLRQDGDYPLIMSKFEKRSDKVLDDFQNLKRYSKENRGSSNNYKENRGLSNNYKR